MADATRFNLGYFFTGEGIKDWWKAWGAGWRLGITILIAVLLIAGGMRVWNFLFPKAKQNISQPRVVALPGSTVGDIDQRTVQVAVEEKPWEIGFTGGVFNYDDKNGAAGFVTLRRKF